MGRWWKWPLCIVVGHQWRPYHSTWRVCDRCGAKAELPEIGGADIYRAWFFIVLGILAALNLVFAEAR